MKKWTFWLFFLLCSGWMPAQQMFKSFARGEWTELRIDPALKDHLDNLPPDEYTEQIRDWMMLSVIQRFSKDEAIELAFDIAPLRYDFQQDLEPFRFGEGRYFPTKSDELIVFSPVGSPRQKAYIARAADEFRLLKGKQPRSVYLFEYQFADEATPNRLRYAGIIAADAVFSSEYGYVEHEVPENSQRGIVAFLAAADDVVFVRKNGKTYTFGGRRFAGYAMKSVTVEDVAAVAQGGDNYAGQLRDRIGKRKLYSEYEDYIANVTDQIAQFCRKKGVTDVAGLKIHLSLLDSSNVQYEQTSPFGFVMPLQWGAERELKPAIAGRCREIMPYNRYEKEYIGRQAADTDNYHFGFSLDHTLRQKAFAANLEKILRGDAVYHRRWFDLFMKERLMRSIAGELDSMTTLMEVLLIDPVFKEQQKVVSDYSGILSDLCKELRREEPLLLYKLIAFLDGNADVSRANAPDAVDLFIEKEIRSVKSEVGIAALSDNRPDRETWQNWLKNAPERADKLRALRIFLHHFKLSHTYQKARYDGNFQGTAAGMTMFYTDLVMKLWGFNYKKSAPEKEILGFKAQTNAPVSPLYYNNIEEKSQTRSWLGLLENSYDIHQGNQLFFSHWATRIFNASPNDLTPGQETAANVSASRFANWWNNHFSQVADFEPEYHRLNQLMKWTQIVFFMKINGDFAFLDQYPVRRNMDFEEWYPAQSELTTRVGIPFINKNDLGERVECMDVLQSEHFTAFDGLDLSYSFTGGVSLGSKGILRARMSAISGTSRAPHRADMSMIRRAAQSGELRYTVGKKTAYTVAPKTGSVTVRRMYEAEFPPAKTTLQGRKFEWTTNGAQRKVHTSENSLDITTDNTGAFKLERDGNAVLVSFKEGKIAKANRIFRTIEKTGDLEKGLSDCAQLEQIYKLPGRSDVWIARVHETGEWLQIERIAKPAGEQFEFVTATGRTWYGGKKYVGGKFITDAEAAKMMENYAWQKIPAQSNVASVIELSPSAPPSSAKTCSFYSKGKSVKITWADDGVYLRKSPESADIISMLSNKNNSDLLAMRRQLTENPGSVILGRTPEGEVIGISENALAPELAARFRTLSEGAREGGIRFAVFQANGTGVRVNARGVLEIPLKTMPEHTEIAAFVFRRSGENPAWKRVFRWRNKLENTDIELLKRIRPENDHFGDAFFEMQYSAGALRAEEALLRYDHARNAPQMIFRDVSGCRVIELPSAVRPVNMDEMAAFIRRFYEDPQAKMGVNEFRKATEPLAQYLREVEKSTNATRIVVMEGEGLNSGLVANLHRLKIRVYKDVPDLALSLTHVRDSIYPDVSEMVFISTVDWTDPRYPGLELMRDSLVRLGIPALYVDSVSELKSTLANETYRQILLLAASSPAGLILADQTLTYISFESWLSRLSRGGKKRDFLYVISSNAIEMERCIAGSYFFAYTITSQLTTGAVGNVAECLAAALDFSASAVGEQVNIRAKGLKKALKKHPDLMAEVEKVSTKTGKTVNVKLGQLSAETKRRFPGEVLFKLRSSAVSPPRTDATFPKVDDIIHEQQRNGWENALPDGEPKNPGRIRTTLWKSTPGGLQGQPVFKVHVDKPDPRIAATC